jgi:putative transposase
MKYRHDKTKVYLVNYHFIWCPKRRKPVLVGKIKERLEEIINEVANEKEIEILALVVNPDHVHLFISANPMIPAHKIVKAFKGRSSRLLRKEFPELLKLPSLWTRSYFVSTAGNVSSETIQHYIEEQSTS